jgi:hypothetical protein
MCILVIAQGVYTHEEKSHPTRMIVAGHLTFSKIEVRDPVFKVGEPIHINLFFTNSGGEVSRTSNLFLLPGLSTNRR